MDRITKEQRSANMSKIGSKNTIPELTAFALLKERKIRFQKHYKAPGKPDIAFPGRKLAVFINGEFWHGRNFKNEQEKLSDFWIEKIQKNIKRDRKNYRLLKKDGWKVIIVWDKDLKNNPKKQINKIEKAYQERSGNKPNLKI